MMEEPEKDRLDQTLREKFEQFAPVPPPGVWAGVAPHITRPPQPALRKRRRPVPLPWLFALTALLAGLGGWLLPHGAAGPGQSAASRAAVVAGHSSATTPQLGATGKMRAANSVSALAKSASEGTGLGANLLKATRQLASQNAEIAHLKTVLAASNRHFSPTTSNTGSTLSLPLYATGRKEKSTSSQPNLSTEATPAAAPVTKAAAETALAAQPQAGTIASGFAIPTAADSTPTTLRPLAALERQTLVQLPSVATLAPGNLPADSRTTLLVNLRQERAELFRLQRRTDSLLLALGDLPGAPLAQPAVAAAPLADTTHPASLKHRWSVLLTATPEQNTLTLQGPETDTLTALRRNHETGRAGVSAALVAEYQLTKRLSIGGGVGYTAFGADLRITNKTTDVNVRFDTITTRSTSVYTSVNHTYSVRIVQVPQPSPVFNSSGQVIRYDTVYVPRRDTVYSTIVQHDTTHTTNHTITPTVTKKETTTTKLLQPTYRFFTVPVLLRYRLSLGPGRWWADVAGGAQFQFFLGGTQVVTQDGVNFRTESITAGNGPFRPLNVALTGSLAINYALTNRLSVSVAPSMRWQALSLYKPETGLRQQPTATGLMFGVRFGL